MADQATPPGETPPPPTDETSTPLEAGSTPAQTPIDSLPQDIQDLLKRTRNEAAQHRRERDEARMRAQGYEQEKMTETERLQVQANEAAARAEKAEGDLMRYRVAQKKGLTGDVIQYLRGSTEAELEQSADDLLAWKGSSGQTPPPPDFGAGARPSGNGSMTPSESFSATLRRAAGRP